MLHIGSCQFTMTMNERENKTGHQLLKIFIVAIIFKLEIFPATNAQINNSNIRL